MKRRVLVNLFVIAGAVGVSCVGHLAIVTSAAEIEVNSAVAAAEQERIEAVARACQSAVSVFATDGGGGGSGVVISSDGYALSNFHVTSPVGRFMKCGMSDGNLYDAVIVGIDPTGDVALIKLFGRDDFVAAEYGDSDDVRVGDWCFAVGNPFLLATDFQPTVTYGIVSGVHRYQYPAGSLLEYADCIQTDAAINPGNSGGPLFNARGQLIGINGRGSFEKRGRVNVGVGYAISLNQIRNFLGHLRGGRIVDHATLGATVTSDSGSGRVVVSNILESSDAHRRGLRYGDEIVAFGGRSIGSVNAFKSVLGIFPRGWRVPLSFIHENVRHDVHVRLSGVHAPEELLRQLRPGKQHGEPEVPETPLPGEPKESPPESRQPPAALNVPEHLAAFFESRSGYANFVFNTQNQARVWDACSQLGDFSDQRGAWKLSGATRDDQEIQIQLTDSQSAGTFGQNSFQIDEGSDLSEQLVPDGSGGLLVAIHLWRRMLVRGPNDFGDVYYLGTCPLPPRTELFDTLVATYDVVETHFYFDRSNGSLVAVEMYPEADVDPCLVYLEDYREVAGRALPHRLLVHFGGREVADIRLDRIEYSDEVASET